MRKILFFAILVFAIIFSTASECNPKISLLNQDPYPAVPGDYVKLVFVVSEISSPSCGEITLELLRNYPLIFEPEFVSIKKMNSGTFSRGFSSNWIVPYKVRIDKDAIDGDSEIEISYSTKGQTDFKIVKNFSIKIEEVKADFDVIVKNYDYSTKRLTLEIINLGKKDVYSLILEVPQQENIKILGGNKNIVGDLDSRDYTSTDFTAIPFDGKIKMIVSYIDKIGERRSVEKEIIFNPSFFEHTKKNGKSYNTYIILAISFVLIISFLIYKKKRKKKIF